MSAELGALKAQSQPASEYRLNDDCVERLDFIFQLAAGVDRFADSYL